MILTLVLLVSAGFASAADSPCFSDDLPGVSPSRSSLRREAIDDCARLILADPSDPMPYYRRARARYVGPSPDRGWNQAPFYDLRVSEEPGRVVADLEFALARAEGREFPDAPRAWLMLGYLHVSRGAWAEAVKAWTKAAADDATKAEARARLRFPRERLVAPDRLAASPPATCSKLELWDCLLVHGCAPDRSPVGGSDALEYRGCFGGPKGLRVRPAAFDCSLLDEEVCGAATGCRWERKACAARPR